MLYHNFVEGYDWVVEGLKDQQYAALANEMELEKAIQHLHRRDFTQVAILLNEQRELIMDFYQSTHVIGLALVILARRN